MQSGVSPSLLHAGLMTGLICLVIVVLYHGAVVLVPVAEAVFVWLVLNAAANAIRRLPLTGRYIPRAAALAMAALIVMLLGFYVAQSSFRTFSALGPQAAGLHEFLHPLTDWTSNRLGITQKELLARLLDSIGIETVLRQIVTAAISLINQFGIVAIYVFFLLLDQPFFGDKLDAAVPDEERRARIKNVLRHIAERIQAYLWIVTIASGGTAALSYAAMVAIGLDHAVFCATMIFFLNFIPTIGSILGTLLPAAFALLQFKQVEPTFTLVVILGLIQFVIGNVLLPRLAGAALNVSLFVTVFSLFVWGALWGVTGMFLAMPMTMTLMIIFGSVDATRPFAIILSRNGRMTLDGKI